MTPEGAWWLVTLYVGLLGLVFGSFMNVCIGRMPEDRSVVTPRSACPHCGAPVLARDNIPVVSWLLLRGRCRACKGPISPLYPTVELLFGVLTVLLFRRVIPDLGYLDTPHIVTFVWYGYLLFAMTALTFIDLRHHIIPDEFSIYGVPIGVGGAALIHWLGGVEGVPTWQQSVVGALLGSGVWIAIMGIYWVIRREEGTGWGDVKLLALLGSYFGGIPAMGVILLFATISGGGVGTILGISRGKGLRVELAFGPFLVFGAGMWLFFSYLFEDWFGRKIAVWEAIF